MKKVLIIGYGYVGSSLRCCFKDNLRVDVYDKYLPKYAKQIAYKDYDFIFLCLPTTSRKDGSCDDSFIKEYLNLFKEINYKGLIVIKSTVPFENIESYFNYLNLVVNPEFLNENTFISDALNQKTIIIGGEPKLCLDLVNLYKNYSLLENSNFKLLKARDAINFKYTRNILSAYLVTFWEHIQDITGNSRLMAEIYKDLRLNDCSQVGMDGYRGFGGNCIEKDVKAINYIKGDKLTKFLLDSNKDFKNV